MIVEKHNFINGRQPAARHLRPPSAFALLPWTQFALHTPSPLSHCDLETRTDDEADDDADIDALDNAVDDAYDDADRGRGLGVVWERLVDVVYFWFTLQACAAPPA